MYLKNPYIDLVPMDCNVLFGLDYVILNNIFLDVIPKQHNGLINRIHICFGGSDPHNLTGMVIDLLVKNKNMISGFENISFDIVIGSSNINYHKIKDKLDKIGLDNFILYHSVKNMAKLLKMADLCIGSTGTSTYERFYIGIPTIVITVANNQVNIGKTLNNIGLVDYIGHHDSFNDNEMIDKINYYLSNSSIVKIISEKIKKVVDGKGCGRIIDAIIK